MKTMKYLSMLLAIVAINMCMMSCDKEDPITQEVEDGFVGTWVYTDTAGSITFQFRANGTGSRVIVIIDGNGNSLTTSENFKYTYSETAAGRGSIQVHIEGDSVVETWSYTLTGNTLMITTSSGVWVLARQ